MLRKLFKMYSGRARARRAEIFRKSFALSPDTQVLDLGGGRGDHINMIIPDHKNVLIADHWEPHLEYARTRFGYKTKQVDGSTRLPFGDQAFDVVFCSSVIEHVTGDKDIVCKEPDGKKFAAEAWELQKAFAAEIRRVGKQYFVQTPYRYFPLESHTWLPGFIVFLPRGLLIKTVHFFNHFWPQKPPVDFYLLTIRQMRELFPDAEIVQEKSFGLTKSLIARKVIPSRPAPVADKRPAAGQMADAAPV